MKRFGGVFKPAAIDQHSHLGYGCHAGCHQQVRCAVLLKGYRSYQPLNTWWAEQEIILHSEFRDGNVPAGYEQLRVFKEALACLPEGIKQVRLRSDTAGYQHNRKCPAVGPEFL
jgi:hypothetical protein